MLNANGPGFKGLYAGDTVRYRLLGPDGWEERNARVLDLLVFDDHVQVAHAWCGFTVDARNYVRLVRRGRRHIAADAHVAAEMAKFPHMAKRYEG
jgi:hypothetical protein